MEDKFTIVLERDGKRYQLKEIEKENGVSPLDFCKGCAFKNSKRCPRNQHGIWLCSITSYGNYCHGVWKEVKE